MSGPTPPAPAARRERVLHPVEWEALYERLGERVFRMCQRMTGDSDLSADLTHDTFVRVAERADQFDGRGSIDGWVFRIARNFALKRIERGRRQAPLDHAPSWAGEHSEGEVESRLVLRKALEKLEPEYRVPLELHEVDGYGHKEIAEMMGCAEGTSRARVSRAKARLRELLKHAL